MALDEDHFGPHPSRGELIHRPPPHQRALGARPRTPPPRQGRVRPRRRRAILDEALVAHVGFAHDGQPFVIPTLHARIGDAVYVHGSSASRTLRTIGGTVPVCITVTLLDGIVFARSMFEMSVNYRSVVILGEARAVTEPDQKLEALRAFSEQVLPGRWDEARKPTRQELKATAILALALDEASAKISTGGPTTARARTPRSTSGPATSRSGSSPASPSRARTCVPGSRCRTASPATSGGSTAAPRPRGTGARARTGSAPPARPCRAAAAGS